MCVGLVLLKESWIFLHWLKHIYKCQMRLIGWWYEISTYCKTQVTEIDQEEICKICSFLMRLLVHKVG